VQPPPGRGGGGGSAGPGAAAGSGSGAASGSATRTLSIASPPTATSVPFAKRSCARERESSGVSGSEKCAAAPSVGAAAVADLQQRDDALKANGGQPMGDLTNALALSPNL
jgi:phospholipase C